MGFSLQLLAAASAVQFALLGGCPGALAQEPARRATPCGGDVIGRGNATRVIDGRTFVLDDAREVGLAGIEVVFEPPPQHTDAGARGSEGPAAKDALAALLSGTEIELRRAEIPSDRYGRLVAYAVTRRDGAELSAQAELIAHGLALVGGQIGSRDCAAELPARENAARAAKLGLWADSYYGLLHADNPTDVLAKRGRFALVEGKVLSVRESGATIYVNLGRRWTEDFTVTIRKRNERSFTAAGVEPKGLAGRRVRVRGWIEQRGGPWIEAARPEQIELADRD